MDRGHNDNEYLNNLRHSASHLLAAAVEALYPGVKQTTGPDIENGFYHDFDFGEAKISNEDLPKIEAKMLELVAGWHNFEEREVTVAQAKKIYSDNTYKIELISDFADQEKKITLNDPGNFLDLCKGGHVENPSKVLNHFKLLSVAGAYWKGSEKNKMLTRIYGTAWPTQKELDNYLEQLKLAEERDHREIGKKLDLFVFSDLVGKGLPMFTAKGATIRRELMRFTEDEEIKRGYQHVITPPLANLDLYRTSGHYPYYKDTMYPPMIVDEEELMLRPMTCPHHFMLYKSKQHSYRELPVRIAEISPQFRYEKSGELTGLLRVRTFTLADAHIIAAPDQAKQVIKESLELIEFMNKTLGLEKGLDYRYRLSLGDRRDDKKFFKEDKSWDYAEKILLDVLNETKSPFFEAQAEAAFYGPKIDVQVKNIHGKEETAFTVQYDFVMPKRFELKYIDSDGSEKQPIVIHRSSIGAFERTIAFLIEKYGGAFPTWLAPIQVEILPIADRHLDYANKILDLLKQSGIRAELDSRAETLSAKIRDAQMQKVPYMLIIGDKEQESDKVSVRSRNRGDLGSLDLNKFLADTKIEIAEKRLSALAK